jgi:hypothetical protein
MRKKATKKIINHRRNKHYKKRNQFFLINRYLDCNFSKNHFFFFFDKSLPRLQLLLFPFLSLCEIEAMKKIPKENQIRQPSERGGLKLLPILEIKENNHQFILLYRLHLKDADLKEGNPFTTWQIITLHH